MEHVVVIPALDPSERLAVLVVRLREEGFERIVVVDDGSSPASSSLFKRLSDSGIVVVHHGENRGKGAAIKTGLRAAYTTFPMAPGCVTVDCDGQHLPRDVRAVCAYSRRHPRALVLGVRDLHDKRVPLRSRFGNRFSALYFRLDTGMRLDDTQTGLRVIPRSLYVTAVETPGERYDFEMNFLTHAVKDGCKVSTVPISTVYGSERCDASHFNPLRDSFLIYRSFFRFAVSSLTCSAIDIGLFTAIILLSQAQAALFVSAANVFARLASGAVNFGLNRQWSFRSSDGRISHQAVRYLALFLAIMCASSVLVGLLSLTVIPAVASKVLVDGGLFVVSYFVQRNWVFSKEKRPGQDRAMSSGVSSTAQRESKHTVRVSDAHAAKTVAQTSREAE